MEAINTNIASLKARHHLSDTRMDLSLSVNKLSSGKRINSASDDAAGMAVADRMLSQSNGLSVAKRNVIDAISLLKISDSATNSQLDILQRIRVLAVQGSNGVLGVDDRKNIDIEVQGLLLETNDIANKTIFNGHKPLKAEIVSGQVQFVSSVPWKETWTHTVVSDGAGGAKLVNEIGEEITDFYSHKDSGYINKITANMQGLVEAMGGGETQVAVIDSLFSCSSKSATTGASYSGSTPVSYDAGYIAAGSWASGDHDNFSITMPIPVSEIGKSFSITYYGSLLYAHLENKNSLEIQIGSNNKQSKTLSMINTTNGGLGLDGVNIRTIESSRDAINTLTNAIDLLMDKRVGMGTQERIFENIVHSISTLQVNTLSSRSRIEDVDFALETAKLTSRKILYKAGISMVLQANSLPQRVLTLLKGI